MINQSKKRAHPGPNSKQKSHKSPTESLDKKVKSPSSGKIGEAHRAQQKAEKAPGSGMGGISSGHEGVGELKGLAITKSHSAYQNQEHAKGGFQNEGSPGKGGMLSNATVSRGKAYSNQSHAKDSSSPAKLKQAEGVQGSTGAYLGHFRNEKYLRQGHNSDGYVPMGPGMANSQVEKPEKSDDINGGKQAEDIKQILDKDKY